LNARPGLAVFILLHDKGSENGNPPEMFFWIPQPPAKQKGGTKDAPVRHVRSLFGRDRRGRARGGEMAPVEMQHKPDHRRLRRQRDRRQHPEAEAELRHQPGLDQSLVDEKCIVTAKPTPGQTNA
jgi:hypothetical protein